MKPSTLAQAKSLIERSRLGASEMHNEQRSFELLTRFFALPSPISLQTTNEKAVHMSVAQLAILITARAHESLHLTSMTYFERKEATALACLLYARAGATHKEVEALVGRYNTAIKLHYKLAKYCTIPPKDPP